ncbi:MAG: outer membrane beta-barrel protein [Steroidobacteraceae bacterium]
MKSCVCVVAAVLVMASAGQASAQTYGYSQTYGYGSQRPIQWHIDGGYAATTGHTADYLDNGWTVGGGFTFRPAPGSPFSLRTDLNFSQFLATNRLISLGEQQNQTRIDDGTGRIVDLNLNAVFDVPLGRSARAYVTGGVGGAWRQIELTQTVGFGGYFCDPWYGYCDVGIIAGDVLVHREETTRFMWNAGLGVEFPLYNGQSWFIEARYNRIATGEPTEFVPIRVGMRF